MDSNDKVYKTWKPLRNLLGKFDLYDSLAVIRWYFTLKQTRLDLSVPSDLEPHPNYQDPAYFLPWELETLSREVIVASDHLTVPRYTMRNPDHLARAVNRLKAIEEVITEEYVNQQNIYQEVSVRLAHRQFKYQTERPNLTNMVRYSKIFSDPSVEEYVKARTGLSTRQIYTISSAFWITFCQNFRLTITNIESQLKDITPEDVERFLNYFAKPIEEVRELLKSPEEHQMNDKFEYAYNSQFAYPIMKVTVAAELSIICPLPTLLVWRSTSGLYYDLYDLKLNGVDFGSVFGIAYENYIGGMLEKTFEKTKIKVYKGEPNTGSNPNTCDWVVESRREVLFVETKTKRLSMAAKTALMSRAEIDAELDVLAKAVVQVYRSYLAYRDGTYSSPAYSYNSRKKHFVAVVTLEEWYLLGDQISQLRDLVTKKLNDLGIDTNLINDAPYVVMSSDDVEHFSYLARTVLMGDTINPYWAGQAGEYHGHEFGTYVDKAFKTELNDYSYVYSDEENNLFTVPLKGKQPMKLSIN